MNLYLTKIYCEALYHNERIFFNEQLSSLSREYLQSNKDDPLKFLDYYLYDELIGSSDYIDNFASLSPVQINSLLSQFSSVHKFLKTFSNLILINLSIFRLLSIVK